jgi:hypothetical protein
MITRMVDSIRHAKNMEVGFVSYFLKCRHRLRVYSFQSLPLNILYIEHKYRRNMLKENQTLTIEFSHRLSELVNWV